jgi:hypothetical protein
MTIANRCIDEGFHVCGCVTLPSVLPHRHITQRYEFCALASTSVYCQEYIFNPENYYAGFRTYGEGDAYLEAALLVACRYEMGRVLEAMVRLVKSGVLPAYKKRKVRGGCGRSGSRWVKEGDGVTRQTVFGLGRNVWREQVTLGPYLP